MLSHAVKQAAKLSAAPAGRRAIHRSANRMAGDHGHHQHYVFEGEFSKGWAKGLALFVVVGGVGVPVFLLKYQNWKNGFPRVEE